LKTEKDKKETEKIKVRDPDILNKKKIEELERTPDIIEIEKL